MIAIEAGLFCFGGFYVFEGVWRCEANLEEKMQHVAEISCKNGIEGEY